MAYILNLCLLLVLAPASGKIQSVIKHDNKVFQSGKVLNLTNLKYLLENMNDHVRMTKKITSLGFHKKLNGIYISNAMVNAKKPRHWLIVTNLAGTGMVSFKTADIYAWKAVISELNQLGKPTMFDPGTSDIAKRYAIGKFKAEVYKPVNGVNLNLNNLYEVILIRERKP